MKPKPKPVAKSFKATLERVPSNLGWIIVRNPDRRPKVWGTRARLRVKGEINGFAIRTSLFPTGKGFHCLTVNKRIQAGANVSPGDTARSASNPTPINASPPYPRNSSASSTKTVPSAAGSTN